MTIFEDHLKRQIAFSRGTFGPGERREMVIDHIRKELVEVERSAGSPREWVDVVILALDGLTRAVRTELESTYSTNMTNAVANEAVALIVEKQSRNEERDWPDWRKAPKGKAIEHIHAEGKE